MADSNLTQRPSLLPSGRSSPKEPDTTLAIIPTMDKLKEQARSTIWLKIVDKQTVTTAADPKEAVTNLNATIIDQCAKQAGQDEIDPTLFMTSYNTHHGVFVITAPDCFMGLLKKLCEDKAIQFTGDAIGNKYKLEYAEAKEEEVRAPKEDNERTWGHIITRKTSTKSDVQVYQAVEAKLTPAGINLHTHKGGFYRMTTKDKEMGTSKFHCTFDIDWARIPRNSFGRVDLSSIKTMTIDEDTGEWATFYITTENADRVFDICGTCYKHTQTCLGHGEQKKRAPGPSSAENAAAAQKRIKGKAAKSFGF